jgi:sporulation protein YlmC with PRC-barrel domain
MTERLGLIERATALIDKQVENRNLKALGKVTDLALDLPRGRVPFVLVSSGSGEQAIAVPARSFSAAYRDKLIIDMDQTKFTAAPHISTANWTANASAFDEASRYFERRPSEAPTGQNAIIAASTILKSRLISQNKEPLGDVEDMLVDLPVGRLVYLVINPSAAKAQGERYAVPPQAVQFDASGGTLMLQASQEQFLSGPHFEKDYWTDMANPSLASSVYGHYGLPAFATATSDVNREPVQARAETPAAGIARTADSADHETTQAVLREFVRGKFADAKAANGITVLSSNGRVTLTGQVNNEQEKTAIGAMAERAVGSGNVDNQLQVGTK